MSLFILQNDRVCVLLLLFDVVEFGFMFDASLSVTATYLMIVREHLSTSKLFHFLIKVLPVTFAVSAHML